jgi:hypothetical protein
LWSARAKACKLTVASIITIAIASIITNSSLIAIAIASIITNSSLITLSSLIALSSIITNIINSSHHSASAFSPPPTLR